MAVGSAPQSRLLLQEVRCSDSLRYDTLRVWHCLKQFGLPVVRVSELQDRRYVATSIAVVGG